MMIRTALFVFINLAATNLFAVSTPWKKFSHSEARFIVDHTSVAPGETVQAGLWLKLRPQWHVYWLNPGESGSAPILKWTLPQDLNAQPILWPTPERIVMGGLTTFGFHGEVFLLQNIRVPQQYTDSTLRLKLEAEWMVCEVICVPQTDSFELLVPVGASQKDPELEPYLEEASKRLPANDSSFKSRWHLEEKKYVLRVEFFEPAEVADFFPEPQLPVNLALPEIKKLSPLEYEVVMKQNDLNLPPPSRVRGVLVYKQKDQTIRAQVDAGASSGRGFFKFLLFAFIGGLILNLMPCVLPIIMLKVFSVLKNTDAKARRQDSLFYTLGIVLSLWVLVGFILALQSAGRMVGWGFQLQSVWFNGFLVGLFVLMGANLWGLLNWGVNLSGPMHKWTTLEGNKGAFFTGLLSVLVASPCTAPFMGVALGYALSQSPPIVFSIFTALGLGLAFPYLLIGFAPRLTRFFPKPGAWMETFKKILAIPLWATALWLGWVLSQQITPRVEAADSLLKWESFSESRIAELKGSTAVFIDFTADWCLSCKVNERAVIQSSEVVTALRGKKIILMKADWTKYDPTITKWLQRYHRAGVPFYLFIYPDGSETTLPELLTKGAFLDALKKIDGA